jgi:hypothetical protein
VAEEKRESTSQQKRGKAKAAPSTITQLEEELEGLSTYGGVDDCQSKPRHQRRGTRKTASPNQSEPKSRLVVDQDERARRDRQTPSGIGWFFR